LDLGGAIVKLATKLSLAPLLVFYGQLDAPLLFGFTNAFPRLAHEMVDFSEAQGWICTF
jgi:hypothetical protein